MKIKLLLFLFFCLVVSKFFGQTQNLKFTDIFGNKFESYEITSEGKFILIDFFTEGCLSCQLIAPYIDTMHREFGCDCGDIFFVGMSASFGSDNQSVFEFTQNFGINFTVASEEGGSAHIAQLLGITMTPFFVLIDTNNNVLMSTYFFSSNQNELKDTLLYFGLNEQLCCGTDFKYYELRTETDTFPAEIDYENKTVYVSVNQGINLEKTIPFFINSSESNVFIDEIEQFSGETVVDFTDSLVLYNIVAQINTFNQEWVVKINEKPLNIKDSKTENKIYPNPSTGILYFSDVSKIDKVIIYNLEGKEIINYKPTNNKQNFSFLDKGIYYFVLKEGDYFYNYKIIIK